MTKAFFLCFMLVLGFGASAQIVTIPDANFKNRLINTACATLNNGWPATYADVDANDDGEIQESEAAQIYRLNVDNADIASLEGIAYFTNLHELYANGNALSTVDLSNLPMLQHVQLQANQISTISVNKAIISINLNHNLLSDLNFISTVSELSSLEVSSNLLSEINIQGNPSLNYLDCSGNGLTSLDVSAFHLTDLRCGGNQLTSLVLCPELQTLSCPDNLLTALDLSVTSGLSELNISNNQLSDVTFPDSVVVLWMSGNLYTSIELSMPKLYGLECKNTHLTSLTIPPFYAAAAEPLDISNNNNLQFINLKNGNIDYYNQPGEPNGPFYYFNIENNPNLEHICFDEAELVNTSVMQGIASDNNANMTFSSYCDFAPGSTNIISGAIGLNCETENTPAPNTKVNLTGPMNTSGLTFTRTSGQYEFYTGPGAFTITPVFENAYYSVTPENAAILFTGTGATENVSFCIAPNGVHPDLEITLIPLTVARPGFDATYKIHYENKGTETQSGAISLNFEDDITDFLSSNPATDAQASGSLTWNFTNLAPFESREITLTLNVNSPLETPAVNIGDTLDFTAVVSAGTDETPADNTFEFDQVVVGSFDPNDKAVSRESIGVAQLGDYLYYTIRFQNTGTFYAENVVVKDMLSANLDLATLQMVSASHSYRATLTNTNKLEFFFEGINLPAVGDDEPGSHGYVTFKIKPKSNIVVGDNIENNASIYFDFNAPIVTNTVTTTVTALGNPEVAASDFVVYPNPAKYAISIQSDATVESVAIYNALGQLVKIANERTTIDVSDLSAGSYLIQIVSDKGKTMKKLIKM